MYLGENEDRTKPSVKDIFKSAVSTVIAPASVISKRTGVTQASAVTYKASAEFLTKLWKYLKWGVILVSGIYLYDLYSRRPRRLFGCSPSASVFKYLCPYGLFAVMTFTVFWYLVT